MESKDSIRLARMFCPANDRNVPILLRHRDTEVGSLGGTPPGEPVSCLEYGFRCSGWLCPHFASPDFPSQDLLELALEGERERARRGTRRRQAILERAIRENREASSKSEPPLA